MPPILFLVSAASSYRLLKFVAEQLIRDGHRVLFVYERGDDALFRTLSRDAEMLGAEALAFEPLVKPGVRSKSAFRHHPRKQSAIMMRASVALARFTKSRPAVARVSELQAALAAQLAAAYALFLRVAPAAIVAAEDGISAPLAMMAAARSAGVRVVVVPFGYGVRRDLELSLDAKAARGELFTNTGPWRSLIEAHAPQWIKTGAHAGALMYEDAYIVAAESLGITVRDPWIIHGGLADALCVESEQMRRVYVSEGVPEAKLVNTGTPYCDMMLRGLEHDAPAKAALRQPRRIDAGQTRILVSWPPSYHRERAAFSEFGTYQEMSVATLEWLAQLPNCRVTVSLHPAVEDADRRAVAATGVHLTDDYVIDLIARHDLFITYFSSTIRWAVAAGKPAVNFDLYGLGLNVYDTAPGVARVRSLADFQQAVTALVTSDAAFTAAANQQIAVAPEWGTLDGHNTERVAATIMAA